VAQHLSRQQKRYHGHDSNDEVSATQHGRDGY